MAQGVATHDIRWKKRPSNPADIRLWFSCHPVVGFGRNMAVWSIFFQVYSLTIYPQLIFFNILRRSARYLIEIWSIFFWYPFTIPLISGWYPWYPDIRCTDFQRDVTPCNGLFSTLLKRTRRHEKHSKLAKKQKKTNVALISFCAIKNLTMDKKWFELSRNPLAVLFLPNFLWGIKKKVQFSTQFPTRWK